MPSIKIERNKRLLVGLLALCIFDLVLTAGELQLGLVVEVNPLMSFLVDNNILYFMGVKLLLTLLCCAAFYRTLSRKLSSFGIRLSVVAYSLVGVLHIGGVLNEVLP